MDEDDGMDADTMASVYRGSDDETTSPYRSRPHFLSPMIAFHFNKDKEIRGSQSAMGLIKAR